MDYRNEMRRDPFARTSYDGRFSPTFALQTGGIAGRTAPSGGGACRGAVPPAVQQGIDTLALAMAYFPRQKFTGIKEPSCALGAGTIFDALDLAFMGCRRGAGR